MISTAYRLYRNDIFTTAKTLVVRHLEAAIIMNHILIAKGYTVNPYDMTTWKYFLNMAGEYHESDLDDIYALNKGASEFMQIKVSSNTGPVDANFTKAQIDPVTGDVSLANEYRYGTDYYNELLTRYPDHESLILGILNPVDTAISVAAEDGDILYCGGYHRSTVIDSLGTRVVYVKRTDAGYLDLNLIEAHELSIIPKLEQWIKGFLVRWHNRDYSAPNIKYDDMYLASMLGILYLNIPKQLLNLRLANCHTAEAHRFHIREFLDSHGFLGRYVDALPLKQLLYLYRNVCWIESNAGKQQVFQSMVDNLATPSNVPLAGYKLRHNLSQQPENILPDTIAQREVINFIHTGSIYKQMTIAQVLGREQDLARENARAIDQQALTINARTQIAWDNEVPTKLIESDMIDPTDQLPFPLAPVLMNLWIYKASLGTYRANIFVTNPVTADRLLLSPLNALILAIYCLNKGYTNTVPDYVPTLVTHNIPRAVQPTLAELKQTIEPKRITDATLTTLKGSGFPSIETDIIGSTDGFYRYAQSIQRELMRQYYVLADEPFATARGQLEFTMSRLYHYELPCALLPTNTLYSQWLSSNGYVVDTLTSDDLIALGLELVRQATGNAVSSVQSKAALQQAVIEIMRQFSSYNVQFVYSINQSDTLLLNTKTIRPDNITTKARSRLRIPFNLLQIRGLSFRTALTVIPVTTIPVVL